MSNTDEPDDIESIIASAKPAEATSIICIRGDLRAEYDRLEGRLSDMTKVATSLAGDQEAIDVARRLADLVEEMRAWERKFHLRAVTPRKKWRDLVAKDPKKTPGMSDEEYADQRHAWLCKVVAMSLVSPASTPEQIERLADQLSDGDWGKLANDAWQVNDRSRDLPFSAAASVLTRSSGGTSKQPETSDSPAHASLAGSPEPSSSTSTTTATG